MDREEAPFIHPHAHGGGARHGLPTTPGPEEGLAGAAGLSQVTLTWGATIVQSLANSTCPDRRKTMTFRKEVNHITHSKSATSWGGPGR